MLTDSRQCIQEVGQKRIHFWKIDCETSPALETRGRYLVPRGTDGGILASAKFLQPKATQHAERIESVFLVEFLVI